MLFEYSNNIINVYNNIGMNMNDTIQDYFNTLQMILKISTEYWTSIYESPQINDSTLNLSNHIDQTNNYIYSQTNSTINTTCKNDNVEGMVRLLIHFNYIDCTAETIFVTLLEFAIQYFYLKAIFKLEYTYCKFFARTYTDIQFQSQGNMLRNTSYKS